MVTNNHSVFLQSIMKLASVVKYKDLDEAIKNSQKLTWLGICFKSSCALHSILIKFFNSYICKVFLPLCKTWNTRGTWTFPCLNSFCFIGIILTMNNYYIPKEHMFAAFISVRRSVTSNRLRNRKYSTAERPKFVSPNSVRVISGDLSESWTWYAKRKCR